jgi:hypothetical protein
MADGVSWTLNMTLVSVLLSDSDSTRPRLGTLSFLPSSSCTS